MLKHGRFTSPFLVAASFLFFSSPLFAKPSRIPHKKKAYWRVIQPKDDLSAKKSLELALERWGECFAVMPPTFVPVQVEAHGTKQQLELETNAPPNIKACLLAKWRDQLSSFPEKWEILLSFSPLGPDASIITFSSRPTPESRRFE